MAIDTSKLSGYAKAYAEAINRGASDAQAHQAAQAKYGKGVSGVTSYTPPSSSSKSSSSSSKSSSGSSSGSSGVIEKTMADLPKDYPQYYSSGGGASAGGYLNPPQDYAFNPEYIRGSSFYSGMNDYQTAAINKILRDRLNQMQTPPALQNPWAQLGGSNPWANWQPPQINLPSVPPPPTLTTQPAPETISNTPEVEGVTSAPPPVTTPTEKLPKGTSGFLLIGGTPVSGTLPTAEDLYNIYKRTIGENAAVKDYLNTPQFRGILSSGNVPLWMASDPTWQVYLRQLGVLSDAIRERLAQVTGNETT